jgi:hypothetical protein
MSWLTVVLKHGTVSLVRDGELRSLMDGTVGKFIHGHLRGAITLITSLFLRIGTPVYHLL